MRELVEQLLESRAAAKGVACCRLLETRGSTPQKPGAMMLVYENGAQAGTLGGGCVEAEVKRRALAVIAGGEPTVAQFCLDSDYGWDDGLICGGRMHVSIDPLADSESRGYYAALSEVLACGSGGTEAIVFDASVDGLPANSSFLFDAKGDLRAQLRAVACPAEVLAGLVPLERRPLPSAKQGVAFLPTLPRSKLIIVGAGHVGQALAALAADLEFDVSIVDDRQDLLSVERFPRATERICGSFGQVLADLEIDARTFCVIVTRGHNHDEETLFHLVDRGASYVGMIGSKRKIRLIFDDLLAEGVSPESLAKVHAPIGIEIGSQTVAEIAVSIAAELIACRNLGRLPEKAQHPQAPAQGRGGRTTGSRR